MPVTTAGDSEQGNQLGMADELLLRSLDAGSADMSIEVLRDRYRYPKGFLDVALQESASSQAGYFRFGANAICYGRSCSTRPMPKPEAPLDDLISLVAVESNKLSLPFHLNEIVDNLRLERYSDVSRLTNDSKRLLKKLYYCIRPFTNRTLRKQVQKFHARNWRQRAFPHWPVDTTVEDIFEIVLLSSMKARGVTEVPFIWFWPKGAAGCLALTHDVETAAGRDFCEDLMDVDDSFGMKAAFGIVPERRYEVSRRFVESMQSRGFEVAIQDLNHDGRLFDDRKEFLRRAEIINRYASEYGAKGFRAAVLYRKPEWFDALEFAFDMSIPNVAPLDPQPGGCCTVLPFFIGKILELPVTTAQDYTLFHVLEERSLDLWKTQIDRILGKNGLLSFIVHPDYLLEPDSFAIYKGLLSYLQEMQEKAKIWIALPSEIDNWWRTRSKMSVVRNGCSWRIVGDGAERAVLAYARNIEGRLVYEFSQATRPISPGR